MVVTLNLAAFVVMFVRSMTTKKQAETDNEREQERTS
jgi:hypothetical protein